MPAGGCLAIHGVTVSRYLVAHERLRAMTPSAPFLLDRPMPRERVAGHSCASIAPFADCSKFSLRCDECQRQRPRSRSARKASVNPLRPVFSGRRDGSMRHPRSKDNVCPSAPASDRSERSISSGGESPTVRPVGRDRRRPAVPDLQDHHDPTQRTPPSRLSTDLMAVLETGQLCPFRLWATCVLADEHSAQSDLTRSEQVRSSILLSGSPSVCWNG